MDLNKIYPLLSDDDQKKIRKIIEIYLGSLASQLGYSLVEKLPTTTTRTLASPPSVDRKARIKWPLNIHGLSIPNKDRLIELYRDSEGLWTQPIEWSKVQYLRNVRGFTIEEIFSKPPSQKSRQELQTKIKRTDKNGKDFFPL